MTLNRESPLQTTPLVAGLAVGAAAYAGRLAIQAFQSFKSAPPRLRQFYKGGFLSEMTRREAALVLGEARPACRTDSAPPPARKYHAHTALMSTL